MLNSFTCANCRLYTTINFETAPNSCPRCGCGVNQGTQLSRNPRLGQSTGVNELKVAPSFTSQVNFRLDRRNSGTRLNNPSRDS